MDGSATVTDAQSALPLVSVCIVTAHREELLRRCLDRLRSQQSPPPFELLVGTNRDPRSAEIVFEHFPGATVLPVGRARPGGARNVLLRHARGDLLLFLDDDVLVRPDLLARLADLSAARPDVGVFGGPNETPPGSSRFQVVQGAVLASIVGSGPARRRYGRHPAGAADERFFTLCNLAVRRQAMLSFADDLICAEENAVLEELRRRRVPMYYDPDLVVFHERRPTAGGFARQIRKYGYGRGQLIAARPRTFRLAFVVPASLVTYVTVLPLLAWMNPLWFLPLAAYGLAVTASAVRVSRSLGRWRVGPLAALQTVLLHFCYGSGVISGFGSHMASSRRRHLSSHRVGSAIRERIDRSPSSDVRAGNRL